MCIKDTFLPSLSFPSVSKQKTRQSVSGVSALSCKSPISPIEAQAKCSSTGEQNSFVFSEGL